MCFPSLSVSRNSFCTPVGVIQAFQLARQFLTGVALQHLNSLSQGNMILFRLVGVHQHLTALHPLHNGGRVNNVLLS